MYKYKLHPAYKQQTTSLSYVKHYVKLQDLSLRNTRVTLPVMHTNIKLHKKCTTIKILQTTQILRARIYNIPTCKVRVQV